MPKLFYIIQIKNNNMQLISADGNPESTYWICVTHVKWWKKMWEIFVFALFPISFLLLILSSLRTRIMLWNVCISCESRIIPSIKLTKSLQSSTEYAMLWICTEATSAFVPAGYNVCGVSLALSTQNTRSGQVMRSRERHFAKGAFPRWHSLSRCFPLYHVPNDEALGGNCNHWDDMSHLEFNALPHPSIFHS